jgi:hypothetical protein
MNKNKLKIGYTIWPNGHKCFWQRVNVDDMFIIDDFGNKWFAWARLFKVYP